MTRYVWLVETSGLTESVDVYGTQRRAVAALVGTEVYDESRRDIKDGPAFLSQDEIYSADDGPVKPLTRREIYAALRENGGQHWAHWSMDGAGNTFVSLMRRSVK